MAQHKGAIPVNKTKWTNAMEEFLKENYLTMTNAQLAKSLGLSLTVTRNKLAELNICRIEMEYWNDAQIQYLKENFTTTGDVELAEYFQKTWPKNKKWTKKHIAKKRRYLKLKRTRAQVKKIIRAHTSKGGRSRTIERNSASTLLTPLYVASKIAWRNKELQAEIIKNHPELIELKIQQIKLQREIKKHEQN